MAMLSPISFSNTVFSVNARPEDAAVGKVTDHVCEICHKVFKRSEHRQRHERAHRQEKPFGCRYCAKRFARKDLLIRHEKTIHAAEWTDPKRKVSTPATIGHLQEVQSRTSKDRTRIDLVGPSKSGQKSSGVSLKKNLPIDADTNNTAMSGLSPSHLGPSRPQTEVSLTNKNFDISEIPFSLPDFGSENSNSHTSISFDGSHNQQSNLDVHEEVVLQQNEGYLDYPGCNNAGASQSNNPNSNANLFGAYHLLPGHHDEFDSLDFFTTLDESIFSQTNYPMLTIGSSTSPQSIGIAGETDRSDQASSLSRNFEVDTTCEAHTQRIDETTRIRSGRKSSRSKQMTIDDEIRDSLLRDLHETHGFTDQQLKIVPNARALHVFLGRFFDCFQKHLPIFHLPSFDTANAHSPLILAMCSIGAIYHLNRKSAAVLRRLANDAISLSDYQKFSGAKRAFPPTWETQCKLLITFGATFGGNAADINDALAELGYFVRLYGLRRTQLSSKTGETHNMDWEEWINNETSKRLLLGIFIQSSLQSATYDISPGFSVLRDLNFEMPAEDCLWEAQTQEIWQENMMRRDTKDTYVISTILCHLMFGVNFDMTSEMCSNISAFGATILMHAANIHLYHLAQCSYAFAGIVVEPSFDQSLKASRLTQVELALTRCHSFLKLWQLANNDSSPDGQDGSLIFNCQALLRLCYVRLFSGRDYFNRTTLLSEDENSLEDAVYTYVKAPQTRNPFLTKSATQVLFCFTAPIRAGHLLVRKTAAFTWSIEHSIAAWDCALFLTKWIHTMEIQERDNPANREERIIMDTLRDLLDEVDSSYDGTTSLAAEVTRTWTLFLDDVWVWEIASRMGCALRKLADAYQEDWVLKKGISTSSIQLDSGV